MLKVYNTGKVQIGLAYEPTVRPHHDEYAVWLQLALLRKPTTFWQRLWGLLS